MVSSAIWNHGKTLGDICFKFVFFVPRPPMLTQNFGQNGEIFEKNEKFDTVISYFLQMYARI